MPRPRQPTTPSNDLRLTWPGRSFEVGQAVPAPRKLRHEECGKDHRFVVGDALEVASTFLTEGLHGKVDLVYLDPPYASQVDYIHEARLDGPADGRTTKTFAYRDRWNAEHGGLGAYLEMLAARLDAMAQLLSPKGTLWVHLDWRAAYLVRVILDEIFGRDGFKNEIVWRRAPNLGRQAKSAQFGRTLDTIVVYGHKDAVLRPPTRLEPVESSAIRTDKEGRPFTTAPRGDYTDASIEKLDAEGRVHRTSNGKVYIKYFAQKLPDGTYARERPIDTLWTDIAPLRHAAPSERTGYPTQKPRELLERIILSGTSPGDTVLDLFAGSGTTAVAAHALGRRALLGDASTLALNTTRARLQRVSASLTVDSFEPVANGAPPAVRVATKKGAVTVTLASPKEPLAWAIDCETRGPFVATRHSQRVHGKTAKPCVTSLDVPRKPRAVRVYLDDGSIGEWQSQSATELVV